MTTQPIHSDGNDPDIPLGFGPINASIGDHIAHFYKGKNQKLDILGPYIAEGLRREERCLFFSKPVDRDEVCQWLFDEGLDVDGAVATGKFILHPAEASAETMVTLANTLLADTENAGYPFLRACGDAAWALEGTKNPYELLRWEALLDKYMENWKAVALCQLDLAQFSGDIVMGALRAHGLCIMGDLLVPNPFHAFPDTLLDELSEAD